MCMIYVFNASNFIFSFIFDHVVLVYTFVSNKDLYNSDQLQGNIFEGGEGRESVYCSKFPITDKF